MAFRSVKAEESEAKLTEENDAFRDVYIRQLIVRSTKALQTRQKKTTAKNATACHTPNCAIQCFYYLRNYYMPQIYYYMPHALSTPNVSLISYR